MMRWIWLSLLLTAPGWAAPLHVQFSGLRPDASGLPAGWSVWTPRPEIAPRAFVDRVRYRATPGSLAVSGNSNPAVFGGWEHLVPGITPGKWYRFVAHYRTQGVPYESSQVLARLLWTDGQGKRTGPPDFPYAVRPEGEWMRLTLDAPAPEGTSGLRMQLLLANAPSGTVWWDDISIEEIPAPGPRNVTIASIKFMPHDTKSSAESVERFVEAVNRAVTGPVDVILLPEGITVAGTGKSYVDVAEPVPGPTTARLGELARGKRAYVAAGIYEREGAAVYNTSVLIGRAGEVVGKYRKVHLPYTEIEAGLTPGDSYPVFRTDFGKVGMMICWDSEFAEPARALALEGAELILLPIWGATEPLVKARALENRVFLAQSCYSNPSFIVDPKGEVQAIATEGGTVAMATIDLNRRYSWPGLGVMRERVPKESRLDIPMPRPGFVR